MSRTETFEVFVNGKKFNCFLEKTTWDYHTPCWSSGKNPSRRVIEAVMAAHPYDPNAPILGFYEYLSNEYSYRFLEQTRDGYVTGKIRFSDNFPCSAWRIVHLV